VQSRIRQRDLVPEHILDTPITIVGAGAIGSWTALCLAKMGFSFLEVFDDDMVDEVNLSSQMFSPSQIEQPKVFALKDIVKAFTGVEIKAVQKRFDLDSRGEGAVVISAVDSMVSRRAIYRSVISSYSKFLIDPRMGAESALLYVCKPHDPSDRERYEKTFYSDQDAVQERCTAKATIYTANMLSGLVCKTVRDVLVGPYKWHSLWSIKDDDFVAFPSVVGGTSP
jgi:molybdopterin/thiamine biosynthesis adenylyltransferase